MGWLNYNNQWASPGGNLFYSTIRKQIICVSQLFESTFLQFKYSEKNIEKDKQTQFGIICQKGVGE